MKSFGLWWYVLDFYQSTQSMLKSTVIHLCEGLQNMLNAFNEYRNRNAQRKRREAVVDAKVWERFLVQYNSTNPKLVHVIYGTFSYEESVDILAAVNKSLTSFNFTPYEITKWGPGSIVALCIGILLCLLILAGAIVAFLHHKRKIVVYV